MSELNNFIQEFKDKINDIDNIESSNCTKWFPGDFTSSTTLCFLFGRGCKWWYTIDSFINDMVDEKRKKFLSPRSIFGQSSQVRPPVYRWTDDRYTYDDLLSTYGTTDLFESDDSYPSLPSWRTSTSKKTPSVPKGVLPWVPTSLFKIDSELSDENYGKTWCRIGDGTELDKKEFGGENPWDSDGLLRKFSEFMRTQWEKDEEYRERIRKKYGL